MKKFLAIFVVFTLIAGVAFADLNLGGGFAYKTEVMKGTNIKDSDVEGGSHVVDSVINAGFSGDNFGGTMRFYASGGASPYWGGSPFGFVWWKPLEQFKIQLGHNPDGDWGAQAIGGWGYNASAQDFVAVDNWVVDSNAFKPLGFGASEYTVLASMYPWIDSTDFDTTAEYQAALLDQYFGSYKEYFRIAREAGFYPGFNASGVAMSIYPAEGVAINIGIPFGGGGHGDGDAALYKILALFHVNAGIDIAGAGKLNLSFKGNTGFWEDNKSVGNIYASFNLTAIENLGVDIGVDFPLPYTANYGKEATMVEPVKIGLGATYSAGDFGVKFRAGMALPSSFDGESNKITALGFNVLPYVNLLDGALTAYLNAGFSFLLDGDDSDNNITGWFVNPYIKVPAGGLTFWAGFQIYGEAWAKGGPNSGDPLTKWAVPIGFSVGF